MRLLERDDTGGVRLTEDLPNNKIPPYAILSHTWGPEEVLFKDMTGGTGKNKAGYAKIRFLRRPSLARWAEILLGRHMLHRQV